MWTISCTPSVTLLFDIQWQRLLETLSHKAVTPFLGNIIMLCIAQLYVVLLRCSDVLKLKRFWLKPL